MPTCDHCSYKCPLDLCPLNQVRKALAFMVYYEPIGVRMACEEFGLDPDQIFDLASEQSGEKNA